VGTNRISREDREARRVMLQDALTRLGESDDADRAAFDVVRALDAYLDAHPATSPPPPVSREQPVTDYERRELSQVRWATMIILGCALVATIVVAVALSGGWPAGVAIAAIWGAALLILTTAS
jgi:hypothetical protein